MNDNKYQRGKIYRIVCNTTGLQYYGSTCEERLCTRLSHHKADYKRHLKNEYPFVRSFEIIKNNDYLILLVENYPCNSKDELHQRERYYIENNDCVNKNIPCRSDQEYWKKYYEENKVEISERMKEFYVINEVKIKEYRNANKYRIKEYREANKDKNREYQKTYREANKDKIKEKNRQYREANKDKIKERDKLYREKMKAPN